MPEARAVHRHSSVCTGPLILAADAAMGNCNDDDTTTNMMPYDSNGVDVTPGRRDLMSKYFPLTETKHSSLLCEYFGVALTFAALGAMIRGLNTRKAKSDSEFSLRFQRMALQTMLKGAMERLHCLARNAQESEEKLKRNSVATAEDRKAWELEMASLLLKVADAEIEVGEMRRRRGEDAKANEKVALIYANREQSWKTERKKLQQEIDLLRRDLLRKEVGSLYGPRQSVRVRYCEECKAKETHVSALEESLSEKDFFCMTAIEEAQCEKRERNALAAKLCIAESMVAELKEKLSMEIANAMQQRLVLAEVTAKQQETECNLTKTLEDLDNAKKELDEMVLSVQNQIATTNRVLIDMEVVQKDVEDKEEVISAMLRRASKEKEEKEEIAKALAHSEAKRRHTENVMHRWKSVVQERDCPSHNRKVANRFHHSLESRSGLHKLADSQREQGSEERQRTRSLTVRQVESLESHFAMHRQKPHGDIQDALRSDKHTMMAERKKEKQLRKLVTLQDPVEATQSTRKAGDVKDPMKALALQQWIELVKGRHVAQLEDKHWHEIEAFERQMRVKDERIKAFRSQLLAMEFESSKMKLEMEALKTKIENTIKRRFRSQTRFLSDVKQECDCKEKSINDDVEPQENLTVELQKSNTNSTLRKMREKEVDKQQDSIWSRATNAETEILKKTLHRTKLEDRLCQNKRDAVEELSSDNSHEHMHHEAQKPISETNVMNTCFDIAVQIGNIMETELQSEWEVQNKKRLGELVREENALVKADVQHLKLQDRLLLEENTDPMLHSNQTIASQAMLVFNSRNFHAGWYSSK